ncbi:MAG: D-cysteine desulfhydrase family protein [Anaerolineae bacterium]
MNDLTRVSLGHWPTPLQELSRLSDALGGPRIWVKRDDLSGLALGGNKTRKLEYLISDALAHSATTVITTGAVQSNHACQTAAAAARYGLRCVLVLSPSAPARQDGNLLLDALFGATIRWTGDRDPADVMNEVSAEERSAGRVPYLIPYGGSNAVGASAYLYAMRELHRQARERGLQFSDMIVASSSGGTQAGLVAGTTSLHLDSNILGIAVAESAETLRPRVHALAQLTLQHLNVRMDVPLERVMVEDGYLGEGYARMGAAECDAITMLAHLEGLLVDPVYTGRALAGLIGLIRSGRWHRDETVLFWHTGGTGALFAYTDRLLSRRSSI